MHIASKMEIMKINTSTFAPTHSCPTYSKVAKEENQLAKNK